MIFGNIEFSHGEFRIIELVAQGYTNKDLAPLSGYTYNTVRQKLKTIYDKTGMWTRVELTLWYLHMKGQRD